ncbi:transcription termination factor Rho [Kytococcus sedentarius]|nr:transcription termination factor Rho [Kytococcus sedentarius]QRO86701.1 transcription termination factor Rho [Kytococcus sedentarius]
MTDMTQPAENPKRSTALSALRLAELQELAASMGIDTTKKRKGDLVAEIRQARVDAGSAQPTAPAQGGETEQAAPRRERTRATSDAGQAPTAGTTTSGTPENAAASTPEDVQDAPGTRGAQNTSDEGDDSDGGSGRTRRGRRGGRTRGESGQDGQQDDGQQDDARTQREQQFQQAPQTDERDDRGQREDRDDQDGQQRESRGDRGNRGDRAQDDRDDRRQGRDNRGNNGPDRGGDDEDDERGGRRRSRRNRRNRGRGRGDDDQQGGQQNRNQDRNQNRGGQDNDADLVPIAGILDVLDSYGFVRTTGYLPGPSDVYVPMQMIKRHGLRKGDAVIGRIKPRHDLEDDNPTPTPQQGRRNQKANKNKFNALVKVDQVNGMDPEDARRRVEFGKLTPLYPQHRMRLENGQKNYTNRIIDLVAPIGKGQRGLIVAPPKAGKTMILQAIANAITENNPEAHLMIVLVDERPEEVTDMQRTVAGEVIASTFDRPADDHTIVAELAIERAKRLVEMGKDVVVLLDSITRLGRAYNIAAPASGRILSGGVDSSALYPPKRFFGAARNIENGGSLTILATALVETGSKMDEVIFEEFKGTGNMELRLSRQLADRRIFPAVDVNASGTRKEEILLNAEELKVVWKLRRVLSALDSQASIELLLDRMRKTGSNGEFLMQVQQTSSIKLEDEED